MLMLMRNVALFASQRSSNDFNKGWPIHNENEVDKSKMKQASDSEFRDWYKKVMNKYKANA